MRVQLSKEHQEGLALLDEIPSEYINQFCVISVDFLLNGENERLYAVAAKKLKIATSRVQGAIVGIMFLLMEATRMKVLSQYDGFNDCLAQLALPEEMINILWMTYSNHQAELRSKFSMTLDNIPQMHFYDLKWRLDMEIAGRSQLKCMTPLFFLQYHTKEGDKHESYIMQSDIATLTHITGQLEDAL
eukprot:Ihof_evm6s47 gene=Ihof_evmTU6s47